MKDEKEKQLFCKKCLVKEMPDGEYFKNLYQYIENIDIDLKVEEDIYQQRLSVCKECNNLLNGMCRICGCFVELRAAMKKNSCPDIEKKW